ncbi:hypothetical protein LZQ00_00335 [Sphingobacterium sp. SRCM116780]|uniref:hypothetical protein n=1 Tax=Sphingobacterium sp. SRCM116780 TaxID=2907623 RepID=UPI001F38A047|nr:hypothetical protein [Sphingobacterium sp. SRCM116780]UIR56290.1 hypothetical protein LZQ00_00335 [Sphingobacterium sp. SRCM116780]
MEKLIPLLIGLAIFGYKSYQNYIKEQEAALKRKKTILPPISPVQRTSPVPKIENKKNHVDIPPPFYAEKIKETNEIQRFKQEREEHRLALSKKAKSMHTDQEKSIADDFDLRKAVIMSIILDRPYQ